MSHPRRVRAPALDVEQEATEPIASKPLSAHQATLRTFFARRLRSSQDVDDYVQDVYARVLASGAWGRGGDPGPGFLIRTASSVLIDRFRRARTRKEDAHTPFEEMHEPGDGGVLSPERILAGRQQLARLEAALKELDPLCRDVFLMARLEEFSHREIGVRMGLTSAQVGRQVEKAVAHLARTMGEAL